MTYKEYRIQYHLTQEEAAARFGVSRRTYARYEKEGLVINKIILSAPILSSLDQFDEIRKQKAFYIDKTSMIQTLLTINPRGCTLFTRPRRFGKSLNLSMLYHFFRLDGDPSLFEGLNIQNNIDLCRVHQNAYPAFMMSLKDVHGMEFEELLARFALSFSFIADKFSSLLSSPKVNSSDKAFLKKAIDKELNPTELSFAFKNLCHLLHAHYGIAPAVFIDEYDVPLEKSSQKGFYQQTLDFMQTLFSSAFKSNEDLSFAIFTGCLRESKENLFTGFNNPLVDGVLDDAFSSSFGFTDEEVYESLKAFHREKEAKRVNTWYGGYRFGKGKLHCPFDVCLYLQNSMKKSIVMETYWKNVSSNDIIFHLLEEAGLQIKEDVERLLQGQSIEKVIDLALSYRDISYGDDLIWNYLVALGYLTVIRRYEDRCVLKIPNAEIRTIFDKQILRYIKTILTPKYAAFPGLMDAYFEGNSEGIASAFNGLLRECVGIHDYARQEKEQEAFYHALVLGVISALPKDEFVLISSNKEKGEGFPDIILENILRKQVIIVEIKLAKNGDFQTSFEEGFAQIAKRHYAEGFPSNMELGHYVMAFSKKQCKVEFRKG